MSLFRLLNYKSNTVRLLSFAVSMFLALSCFSQTKLVEIYVDNGEFIKGELIAIGSDILLVRTDDRIESVERENVQFVLPAGSVKRSSRAANTSSSSGYRNASAYRPRESRVQRNRQNILDNKWMSELSGGMYPITPFVLDMSYTLWKRLGGTWAVGGGVSWNFSQYSMAKFSLQGRKFLAKEGVAKPFLNASFAMSPTAGFFGPFGGWGWQVIDFSPVTQGTAGVGILIDSGVKLGLTTHFGFAATLYSTEEILWDNRRITASYQHYGPYLLMGLIF